jgi:NAD(P)-dependent dehydrogenase (short-subunit alcohol dehydrogenase family)
VRARVAVVTGGDRGIGRAIAFALAREGAVVVVAARSWDSLTRTARDVEKTGTECLPIECDIRDEGSVRRMSDAVLEQYDRVDAVVANAGVAGPTRAMHEIGLAEWRDCVATNLDGTFLTFRAFIPRMIEQQAGVLIAVSSMTGKRPLPGRTAYSASKMGLIGLVRTLAAELGPYGIRVNSVCPGAVAGPRIEDVIRRQAERQGISEDDARSQFRDASPLRRLVQAEEVAAACAYLSSDKATAITGEDLNVSAGLVMY